MLEQQDKNADAENLYREALRSEPQNEMARVNLGALLLKRGKFAEAAEELRPAVQLNPRSANARLGLAMALEQANLPEAVEQYEEILRIDPANAAAQRRLEKARTRQTVSAK